MIKSFKNKGLQKLFENDDLIGVQAKDVKRIKLRLLLLDEATTTEDFRAYPGQPDRFYILCGVYVTIMVTQLPRLYPRPIGRGFTRNIGKICV
ncbi:type II toxin-antitoxin system RelE/ParE family toxin [Enterobacter hormaechei]